MPIKLKNERNDVNLISAMLAVLFSLMPLVVVPAFREAIALPKIIIMAGGVLGAVLFCFPLIQRFFTQKPVLSTPVKWECLYLVLITATLPFSAYIYRSWVGTNGRLEGYFVLLLYGALFLLAVFFYRPEKWHFQLYLGAASVMALHAIFIRYEGVLFGIDGKTSGVLFFQYTGCGNQNFLGSYMTLALPVAFYAVLKEGKWAYLPAGLIYFGLLCSNTRGSWIGACLMFCIMVVLYWKEKGCPRRIVALCLIFAGITLLYFLTNTSFAGRFESFSSVVARGFIYSIVIKLIAMRPLTGWGIESLDLVIMDTFRQEVIDYYGYYAPIDKAHCEILQVAVCSGIPAAAAFVGTQVSTVVRGIRHFERWAPWSPLLFSVAGYMVAALWNISNVNVAPVFWIFCGMIVSMTNQQEAMTI